MARLFAELRRLLSDTSGEHLTGRPPHRPSADDVAVQVRHGFARIRPVVEHQPEPGFTVYPNPFTDMITVGIGRVISGPATATVYNLNGTIAVTYPIGDSQPAIQLNLEWLEKGMYILSIRNARGTWHQKIIKL